MSARVHSIQFIDKAKETLSIMSSHFRVFCRLETCLSRQRKEKYFTWVEINWIYTLKLDDDKHTCELFWNSFEELLNGCAVSNKGGGHLESSWWDITDSSLHIVGDPFHEVAAVLILYVEHLFVDLLHTHAASEDGGDGEVPAMSRITGGHHVFGIEHLLCQFGNCEGSVLLTASGGERCEAGHKEVETRERNHVDR